MSGYVATEVHTGAENGCWAREADAIACAERMTNRFPNSEWFVKEAPSARGLYPPDSTFFRNPEPLAKLEALAQK